MRTVFSLLVCHVDPGQAARRRGRNFHRPSSSKHCRSQSMRRTAQHSRFGSRTCLICWQQVLRVRRSSKIILYLRRTTSRLRSNMPLGKAITSSRSSNCAPSRRCTIVASTGVPARNEGHSAEHVVDCGLAAASAAMAQLSFGSAYQTRGVVNSCRGSPASNRISLALSRAERLSSRSCEHSCRDSSLKGQSS